jgi:hypothetical protein
MLILTFGKSSGRADTYELMPLMDVQPLAEWSAAHSAILTTWTAIDLSAVPLFEAQGLDTLLEQLRASRGTGVVLRCVNRHASAAYSLIGRAATAGAPPAGAIGVIVPAGGMVELQLPQGVTLYHRLTPAPVA